MSWPAEHAARIARETESGDSIFPCPGSGSNLRSRNVTLENAALLLFARNLLYLVVFVTSACGPLAPLRQPAPRHPRKRESLGSGRAGGRNKEECDGTHAT